MNKKNGFPATWAGTFLPLVAALSILVSGRVYAQTEQTFDELTIGAQTYKNVTVTTKAKSYVMLMHSQGLANIRVADLSPELRQKFGYRSAEEEKPKTKTAEVTKWAKQTFSSIKIDQVRAMESNFKQKWTEKSASGDLPMIKTITPQMMYGAAAAVLVLWIIYCACLQTICKKAGKEPGFLVWLPFLQIFPILSAAKMSLAWILGCPFGITQIVWCFKIAKARGKGGLTGFCLLFPPTSLFAFLYLTFADGAGAGKSDKRPKLGGARIMSLETA
jgi:hypothetical protein